MTRHRLFNRSALSLVFCTFVWLLFSGCGGDSSDERFGKIGTTGRIVTIDEVLSSQFKSLKQYDIADLPGASAAIYGFMKRGSEAFDYEVRIYASHELAIELGTAFAEEGAGSDAALTEDDAVFKEGVMDRRLAYGADRGAAGPKYGEYVIYENLIVMCQGANADQGMERCEFFVSELGPAE
jgi:hypothetical protein